MLYKEFETNLKKIIDKTVNEHIHKTPINETSSIFHVIKKEIEKYVSSTYPEITIDEFVSDDGLTYFLYLKVASGLLKRKRPLQAAIVDITVKAVKSKTDELIEDFSVKITRPKFLTRSAAAACKLTFDMTLYADNKIKYNDEMDELIPFFYESMKKEYYFMLYTGMQKIVDDALYLYRHQNLIYYGKFRGGYGVLQNKLKKFNLNFCEPVGLEYLQQLFEKKRCYDVKISVYENSTLTDTKEFKNMPTLGVNFIRSMCKEDFFNKVHIPACGTAKIAMKITDIFTGYERTVEDCFKY